MQNCSKSGNPVTWRSRAKPARNGREGVETRRAAPETGEVSGNGEGIVQTPNPGEKAGAAKAVAGYENPLGRKVREGSSPSARAIFSLLFSWPYGPPFVSVTELVSRGVPK